MNRKKFIQLNSMFVTGSLLMSPLINYGAKKMSKKAKEELFKINSNQTPLPYAYDALQDVIDATTMEIHYSKHAAGYSKNFAQAMTDEHVNFSSYDTLFTSIDKYSSKLRNNAGGHYNHELFWSLLQTPTENNAPSSTFLKKINADFNSLAELKIAFNTAAKTQFGSGWAWLIVDSNKKLQICSTPNQDNPLMTPFVKSNGFPLLALDVWEHAYYLKYQNKRADYIDGFWKIINWQVIEDRYYACCI